MHPHPSQVCVIVIGFNDAAHISDAVRSALAQGPAVREVIAVDDCSTDDTPAVLDRLAADDPRVKVIRCPVNSGGCGTPRNTGIEATTSPYVMFLDSDDVLPPGAVDALLGAAIEHDTQVAAGLCIRRELPSGREIPWERSLYTQPSVVSRPSRLTRLVHDTLCVNKLYRTDFLREHDIRFPEGHFPYEDIVFTARILAAAPRIALIPDTVYVWHVRRSAERLSISLDRSGIENWRARMEANQIAYDIILGAGEKRLARAVHAKFLDHELRMYMRELQLRSAAYRSEWWTLTRAFLSKFDASDFIVNPTAPGRVIARVVLTAPEPRDLPRLKELAARPARLLPPYARSAESLPVWSEDLPEVSLEQFLLRPVQVLPAAFDAELRPRASGTRLRLRLHELYGRLAEAGPTSVDVEFVHRDEGHVGQSHTVELTPDGDSWTAQAPVDLSALGTGTWDLRLRLHFRDGASRETTAHAVAGPGLLRRGIVPDVRHGVLLVQPYATHAGALSLRLAPGLRGLTGVVGRRLKRLLH